MSVMPERFNTASALTISVLVPAMRWCGVHHPHGPHNFVVPSGMTGMNATCPGSSCDCESAKAGDAS